MIQLPERGKGTFGPNQKLWYYGEYGVFPNTWVWILQFLLKPGKSRTQGLWVLEKHLVHDQHRFLSDVGFSVGHLERGNRKEHRDRLFNQKLGEKRKRKKVSPVGKPLDILSITHQCHDVIGQVPSEVGGHKTGEASEGNTCIILVGTAKILGEKSWGKK